MSERVTYIEIDLKRCSNTYGSAPCTAAVGVTGDIKCFNGLGTCQDKINYTQELETVRFNVPSTLTDVSEISIPNVKSVQYTPAKLKLGESIGVRSSLSVSFADHKFPDTGPAGDRYLADRTYDPYSQGTFWGKFRARFPYLRGHKIRLIQGTTSQSVAQMETRHFIIDSVVGPTSNGDYSIIAKDALKLTDSKRAQAPKLSNGYLSAAITAGSTSVTLNPVGVGDSEYPSSGLAAIGGKEIVSFSRSGDVFTITRAQQETEAVEHDADDRFQLCLAYTAQDPADIFNSLLTNYSNIESSWIPLSTWQAETSSYIGRVYGAVIAEPTPVVTLINELLEQTATSMWWDDLNQLIRLRVLRLAGIDAALYDSSVILQNSFNAKDQPDKRVSQVWTYYGLKNPLEKLDEPKNYRSTLATISAESETNHDSQPAIKELFSRWIPAFSRDNAETLNKIILSRYSEPPRMFGFRLMRDSGIFEPEPAGNYLLSDLMIQDATGANPTTEIQSVSVKSDIDFITVQAEEVLYSETIVPVDPTIKPVTIDSSVNNINLKSIFDTIYSSADSGDTITITIESGVTIGSTSTGLYSLRTGTWPAGVTVIINNNGTVHAKGGAGGNGGYITVPSGNVYGSVATNGANGGNGGHAILVESNITIDNDNGKIYSGGGGGGGGGGAFQFVPPGVIIPPPIIVDIGGSGGGGGASVEKSIGGTGGDSNIEGNIQGLSGNIGVNTIGGTGGAAVASNPAILAFSLNGGVGGNGGNAGLSGASGADGFISSAAYVQNTSLGGAGGLAGNAIVQSGGTATITNTGDIRGAIV